MICFSFQNFAQYGNKLKQKQLVFSSDFIKYDKVDQYPKSSVLAQKAKIF